MRHQGIVIWEGPSPVDGAPIVMIASGLDRQSKNRKTGAMVQTWILRADMPPIEALRVGADESICGSCPLRGRFVEGRRVERSCYVNVIQAPGAVWRAYRAGTYARVTPEEAAVILAGRAVRLGAYGDPAMVPFDVVSAALAQVTNWTGYTHQWRTTDPRWAGVLMASCDNTDDLREARRAGWRAFVVVPQGAPLPSGTVECAATRERAPRQCIDCGMCMGTRGGTRTGAVSVAIQAHGVGAKHIAA